MLWQHRCHCNPDQYDKFSSTVVVIFPNVCLWRRSLCSYLAFTLKNCIEPPSYASTAYVVEIWPSFLFDSFAKTLGHLREFFGQMVYRPPCQKISRTPMASAINSLSDEPSPEVAPAYENCFLFKIILFCWLASVMQPLPLSKVMSDARLNWRLSVKKHSPLTTVR